MKLGDRADFGAVSFAAFDPLTAERVFAAPGLYDAINVRVDKGADLHAVQRSLRAAIGPGYEVQVSQFVANETRKPIDEFLTALNDALLGFAGVGVLVGGFIIFNTFTILISQRTRELGLLRAMGASGTQVVGSVLVEAGIVGVVASLMGFVLGIALASFLLWLLPQIGFPVPGGPLVVFGRTLVAAAVVGVGVTMLAAVFPAVRAARTPPIAAIGDLRITRASTRRLRRAVLGVIVFATGIAVGLYGVYGDLDPNNAVAITFIGGFIVFVGLVVVGPLFMRRLSGGIGRPLPAALGITGSLARSNAMRNPRRTNATAAALVVGLALVALVAIFAASLKTSVRSALDDVRADYVLTASQFAGFSPEVSTRVRATPGVASAVSFRFGDAEVGKNTETINGTSARGINDVLDLRFVAGSADDLTRGGLLLSEKEATSYHRRVGQTLGIGFPRHGRAEPARRRDLQDPPIQWCVPDRLHRLEACVREGFRRHPAGHLALREGAPRTGGDGRASARPTARRPVPERHGEDARRVPRDPARHRRPVPQRVHRAAAALGGDRGARHREHADALGLRTDA